MKDLCCFDESPALLSGLLASRYCNRHRFVSFKLSPLFAQAGANAAAHTTDHAYRERKAAPSPPRNSIGTAALRGMGTLRNRTSVCYVVVQQG